MGKISISLNRIIYYTILMPLFLASCSPQGIVDEKVGEVYSSCKQERCIINFDLALEKKWDWMYVLHESVSDQGIKELTGIEYPGEKDMSRLILFIKDDKIVYEQKDLSVEDPYRVSFDRNMPYKFHKTEAMFEISVMDDKSLFLRNVEKKGSALF